MDAALLVSIMALGPLAPLLKVVFVGGFVVFLFGYAALCLIAILRDVYRWARRMVRP